MDENIEEPIETTNVDILFSIYRLCRVKYKTTFDDFMNNEIQDMFDFIIFDFIRHPVEENSEEEFEDFE
ncbi:MAG: hypothetical protein Q8936_16765 [Bacillota bacterium]|nr:hypothetical protein [Bacillota bacterium]